MLPIIALGGLSHLTVAKFVDAAFGVMLMRCAMKTPKSEVTSLVPKEAEVTREGQRSTSLRSEQRRSDQANSGSNTETDR